MNSSSPSSTKPPPYARELIEKEVAHLKNRTSSRHAAEQKRTWAKVIVTAVILGLAWLWGMDAVLFSYERGDAINVYLYLHNYGDEAKAQAVADAGLLMPGEVKFLNARQGSFQDYFSGTAAAENRAGELIAAMHQVNDLQHYHYDQLSPVNKVRYFLFMKTGLIPPTRWDVLNSAIDK